MKIVLAELIGTFCLVFFGTGAVVVGEVYPGSATTLTIALVFGSIVTLMILAVGKKSGAHINPAVTLAIYWSGAMPINKIFQYIISQLCGAVLASLSISLLFPNSVFLGLTMPTAGILPSFIIESAFTFLLVYVILVMSRRLHSDTWQIALAAGVIIFLAAYTVGPLTGASLNPARSIGPALISGRLDHLWLYIVSPIMGAGLATLFCSSAHGRGCCVTCIQ